MTQAGTQPPAAPPADPVRGALDDPDVMADLSRHACSRLGVLLADRPVTVREDVARDAVQEAIGRALSRPGSYDRTHGTVAAWLHGILERVLHELCRSLRKQPAQPAADPAAWDNLAARMSGPDGIAELAPLLARLTDEQRRIIALHHLDGMSHERIAAELGISVGNSRLRLARAMRALRDLADKEGGR